ncbi:MAG: hypothetical protein D6710_07680, partial [Nitrospirae bacterium]
TEYRPFIRDGFGKVYLPGTAIKGVFRTAVLYCMLKRFKETNSLEFEKQIVEQIEKTKPHLFKKRDPFLWLQQKFLSQITKGS